MTSLRGHLWAASMRVRGLVDDHGQLVNHARGIADGTTELGHIFPEGSNVGESEALPVIWEEPEEFAAAIEKVKQASAAFVEAAESGDAEAIGGAFRELGGACRGCHDRFRVAHD
jgi:cytochrome c556